AVKTLLRRDRPVFPAVSTNEGLPGSAPNLGMLLTRRHYYFAPFGQDAPYTKPRSLVADMSQIPATIASALRGEQQQPLLLGS
ncbi:MAG: dipicolinate synthase subunit B, partial [Butyricicoccus sp.]|nr:dipicolinate synthase subunit B [Butyricicoccus sp.]